MVKEKSLISNKEHFNGEVFVNLSNFQDQSIYDAWLDLFDKEGNKLQGKIHTRMQWIYSKVIQ